MKNEKRKKGRPPSWTDELKEKAFVKAINLVAEGSPLSRALFDNDDLPSPSTFYDWLENSEDFSNRYARALECREKLIFDEMLEIADARGKDTFIDPRTGKEQIDKKIVERDRLRLDARKWVLGRMRPLKYGDRMITDSKVEVNDKRVDLSTLSVEELMLYRKIHGSE